MGLLPNSEVEFAITGGNVVLRRSTRPGRRGRRVVAALRGRANRKMSTDEIMALTRGK